MTPLIREIVSLDPEMALACTWFDMGRLPTFTFSWRELPGSRLPFEKCAIAGRDARGDKFLVLATQADETALLLTGWALLPHRFTRTPMFAVVFDAESVGCHLANVEGEDEITKDAAAPIVGIAAEFLRAAHPIGYRATAKPRSLTNQRRAEKGKPPLIYDWHTVEIEPKAPSGESKGGTHASPRHHIRRGHWRTCAGGKRVWVRWTSVGDPARGTVFKDYEVAHG